MATIAAIAGAAASAYGSYSSSQSARRAGRGGGQVDMTSERTPWGPSGPLRESLMQRAYNQTENPTQSFDQWMAVRGGSAAPRGGGAAGRGKPPAGQRYNRAGRLVPARNPAPGQGGAAGGAAPAPFQGVSPETDRIRNEMIDRAEAGNPLYEVAEDYTAGTLRGEDQNAYRRETFDRLRDVNDPDLQRMKDYLFGQLEGGGTGGSGTRNSTGGANRRYGGGSMLPGGGGGDGPTGAAAQIRAMLEEEYGANPFLQQSIDDALDDQQRAFASQVIPGLNSQYAGSGQFGGSMYAQALAQAGEAQSRGLAKESNTRRANDYNDWQARRMEALGLGTTYDMNAANAAASRASSGAGAANAQAALDLQRQGMLLDSLGGAVGQGVGLRQFGLGGMGSLAEGFSGDQQFALGGVPDISGLSLRDWGAAGDLSLGADQNRNQFQLGREDIAARRSAAGAAQRLAQQQFQFDIFRDERGFPLANIGGAADIVRGLSDPYGTTRETGIDRRSQTPYTGSSTAEAISGGLAGGLMGYQFGSMYNRGGGGGQPAYQPGYNEAGW